MNEAECKGTEESIENCPHQIISDTDECYIDEAAGVICEGKKMNHVRGLIIRT